MKKVVGEQDLALQLHFPYKSSKFFENSNCRINSLFNSRGLISIFDVLFPFIAHDMKSFEETFSHVIPAAKGLLDP